MTERQGAVRPTRRGIIAPWLSKRRSFLLTLALLVGAAAIAQVVPPTPAPTFCTASACYTSRDLAEASLLNGSDYNGADALLEHMQTRHMSPTTLRLQFWLRDRPADEAKQPSYFANYGPQGTSDGACTLGDDQSALPNWCADIEALVALGESRFETAWSGLGCTITGTVMTSDFDADLDLISNNTVRQRIELQLLSRLRPGDRAVCSE